MTIRLTLLCHASTEALRAARFPRDEPLDAQGRRKTAAIAGRLPRAEHCWTSPALRTRQTAEVLGLTPLPQPALRECDYGRWAGSTLDEISASEPEAARRWLADPAAAPHGGESLSELLRRVAAWMDGLEEGRGQLLAITHASVVRAGILHALAADAGAFWRIDIGPLSRTDLHRSQGQWKLRSANCGVLESGRE